MPSSSPAAQALARRLLARAGTATAPEATPAANPKADRVEAAAPADPVAAAERAARELAQELARSLGPYGVHALLTRALAQARGDHPALAAVRVRAPDAFGLEGLAAATQPHGAGAVTAGVAAVLAALIDLLGYVIGDDMAVNLVSQLTMHPTPTVDARPEPVAPGAPGAPTAGAAP